VRTYTWIAVVFIAATAGLFWTYGVTARTLVDLALVIAGLVPAILRATPGLYVRWKKLQFWSGNIPTTWEVNARFKDFTSGATVEQVGAHLQTTTPGTTRLAESPGRMVLRTQRFVVEVSAPVVLSNSAEHDDEIAISVAPVTVGYRDSRKFLERDLLPLIERVRDHVAARWASYSLRVDLPEKNPYVGLYLQQFTTAPIQEFRIQFALPVSNATKIVVGKERMTVVSDTVEQFRQAISAALAFRIPEN